MYVIGYSDTWDEWTISKVPDNMLDSQCWSYSYNGRPATVDDVDVVTTYYYDDTHVEFGGTDYRILIPEGEGIWRKTITDAYYQGYVAITDYMEEQRSEWEDEKYAEGNEW